MTSKTYIVRLRVGDAIKIRFYSSGIYTVIDPRGYEHEEGEWHTEQWTDENGNPYKTKSYKSYLGAPFGHKPYDCLRQKDLAGKLADDAFWKYKTDSQTKL